MADVGFSCATTDALARAEAIVTARGARLTELRRQVLGLILDNPAPIGAYELLDRLRAERGAGAAPPTVYRTLDFLVEHDLVHRLERLSAYVGCVIPEHEHATHADCTHAAQFFICRDCGRTIELEDAAVSDAIATAAARAGFTLGRVTVEADGVCASCATVG